ncbi:ATP-grasp domain-containing protein [Solirubrum puertoriconensis]|uniref:ATP-dependent carboxylate-amine ligase n=1 Tax=Solirubrum puertoriconensis TaxID=1751427 RepID=A0A9X0HM87_SOLP1|nr:ATP-dependent carboxylate-amine ligase [Solirubrum puertoriconensis]KUG08556.1 ATP-dependent carboxylate-amine ligase [Solirubrum puertoriconensis]
MAHYPKPIGIYYEHPEWFKPLFAELDRRGLPYEKIDAAHHLFDPSESESRYGLVINRMSSSAYLRGHGQGIFHTAGFLTHLERLGVRVINGTVASGIETNKARQLDLLAGLGLKFPKSRVVNHVSRIPDAAKELSFPLVVKVNIGGSGAGIVRFDTPEGLQAAVDNGQIDLGIDQTALVQEFVAPRGGHITRVETLNGKFLYAMKVYTTGTSFNLCPAEICQIPDEPAAEGEFCLTTAPKKGIQVEATTPPAEVIEAVERLVAAAKIDVGGIEYLVDDRTGDVLFYDINALSNFVADAVNVVGFDPYALFVDYLEQELKLATEKALA